MKKKGKQRGYVLAVVMILCVAMTITAISTFTIITRYMIHSMENAQGLQDKPGFSTTTTTVSSVDEYLLHLEEIC